jgi:hypothetical protein
MIGRRQPNTRDQIHPAQFFQRNATPIGSSLLGSQSTFAFAAGLVAQNPKPPFRGYSLIYADRTV